MDVLERRQQFWERVEIKFLLFGTETIEQRLISNNDSKNIVEIFETYSKLIGKENINRELKLLTNNITNGILPVDEKTLNSLGQKHLLSQPAYEETLTNGKPCKPVIHLIIFDNINEELVKKAAVRTKDVSRPSGLDADWRRKILIF